MRGLGFLGRVQGYTGFGFQSLRLVELCRDWAPFGLQGSECGVLF